MSDYVEVTVEATGEKQSIPAHWVGHPVLSKGFKIPQSVRAEAKAEGDTKAKSAQKEN